MKYLRILCSVLILALAITVPAVVRAGEETIPLAELPPGSIVIDPSANWVYRSGNDYSGDPFKTAPVEWIVIKHNHFAPGSTLLLSRELVASCAFGDSNYWADGSLRTWLRTEFYQHLTEDFRDALQLTTTFTEDVELTDETVFLLSMTEYGEEDAYCEGNHGTDPGFFTTDEFRIAALDGTPFNYWTRSPDKDRDAMTRIIWTTGNPFMSGACGTPRGVRPAVNLSSSVRVTTTPDNKIYSFKWNTPVARNTDGDPDGYYFPGDTYSLALVGLPPAENLQVEFYVDDQPAPVLTQLSEEAGVWQLNLIANICGEADLSGEISSGLPRGQVSVIIRAENKVFGPLNTHPSGSAMVGQPWQIDGLATNLRQIADLTASSDSVVLTAEGTGSIVFAPGLTPEDFFTLNGDIAIEFKQEQKHFRVSVDTAAASFLGGQPAEITLFDFAAQLGTDLREDNFRDLIKLTVIGNDGQPTANVEDYIDSDNIRYNAEADTLAIPVYHFTDYIIGLAGQELPVTDAGVTPWLPLAALLLIAGGLLAAKRSAINSR